MSKSASQMCLHHFSMKPTSASLLLFPLLLFTFIFNIYLPLPPMFCSPHGEVECPEDGKFRLVCVPPVLACSGELCHASTSTPPLPPPNTTLSSSSFCQPVCVCVFPLFLYLPSSFTHTFFFCFFSPLHLNLKPNEACWQRVEWERCSAIVLMHSPSPDCCRKRL